MVAFQDVNVPTSTESPWFADLNLVNTMVDAGEKSHYGMWPHTICGICGLQPLLTSGLEYVIKPTEFIKNDCVFQKMNLNIQKMNLNIWFSCQKSIVEYTSSESILKFDCKS